MNRKTYIKNAKEFIRKIQVLLCALSFLSAPTAHAGLWDDFKSPVTTDAKWILLSGAGVTLATVASHRSVFVNFEDRTVEKKPLGSASKYGDALGQLVPNILYIGGAMASKYWGSKSYYYRAVLMFEATAFAALVTTTLKYTIREPRPSESNARNSFPSGHATTAFAFAGVVAAEHGWVYGAPAMLLATFVAYSRINDNQHRVHDLVAGATVGLSYAYGIYYSHQEEREKASAAFHLIPVAIPGGGELTALWTF